MTAVEDRPTEPATSFSIKDVVRRHHRSFSSASSAQPHAMDWLVQYGPAGLGMLAVSLAEWIAAGRVELRASLPDLLAVGTTLLAGLLFSAMLTVVDKIVDMDMAGPDPTERTVATADRLLDLAANAGFAALVAGGTTGLLVLGSVVTAVDELTAIASLGALLLLGTTGTLVIRRMFAEARIRADRIRSGQSRRDTRRQ
jgi:hypothetical protein